MDGGLKDTGLLQDGHYPRKEHMKSGTQDDIDAETIYNMLEYEIVPAYYSFKR